MKCRGFQFELGKEYEEAEAKLCQKGFHGCEYPLDVFAHYAPADSRFFVADLDGVTDEVESEDTKRVGTKIKLRAEIGIPGLVKAAVEYIKEKAESCDNQTGDQSAATNTGNRSAATNTGDQSAATNTGYQSAATNTGNRSAATVEGKESVAVVTGRESKASGALGCWLVLTERDVWNGETYPIKEVRAVKVDGETIKAGVFYKLKSGEVVEA
jgi:hypothetical protein